MSQWKGPFEELYGFALETGAKDGLTQIESLRNEFNDHGTIGGVKLDLPKGTVRKVLKAVADAAETAAKDVKKREPYSWSKVTSHPPRVF